MCHIEIFSIIRILVHLIPRELVVGTTLRESVIAHGQDLIVLTHDARADLCVRVLGAHGRKLCNSHEILVPGNVSISLF